MTSFYLYIPAKFNCLLRASAFIKEACTYLPKNVHSPVFLNDVELAISEACTNAMVHGKKPNSQGQLIVNIDIFPETLRIRVMDQGKGFDLGKVYPPNLDVPQENGYGIFIIKSKMDTMEYQVGMTWNTMTMEKYY